ncbi:hypothetical protein [Halalkalibacillus halophilus]|uniref:hypothetical protein n=1 Tax=Halalkalibacillus halophilus TaxID=392827 RepID=UPI0003FA9FDB|nr:hypothetical protein [Halalkalibacillus halophilus]
MKAFIIALIIGIFLLSTPFIIWFMQSDEQLDVLVLNKTVPDESYREHQGLYWLLNHSKYTPSDKERYEMNNDYYGFFPDEEAEAYSTRSLPNEITDTDLIYIADTYGVSASDLAWEDSSDDQNELIYGGLQEEEWQTIENRINSTPTDLVMEFNSFASPTHENVREQVTDFLQLDWTGWTGRYFQELHPSESEVPAWIVERYESNQQSWDYQGEGYILVDDATEDVIVLSQEKGGLNDSKLHMEFTSAGEELLGVKDSTAYQYWFDIVEPEHEEQTMATFSLNVTDEGDDLLKENNLPHEFPAVLHHQKQDSNIYYFAGDFVDLENIPTVYQYAGLDTIRSLLSFEFINPQTSFFWKTYRPMMENILAKASETQMDVDEVSTTETNNQAQLNDNKYPSRIAGEHFEVYQNGEWKDLTIKGVNLGMGKPGAFPGQAAISKEEYERWFQQIGQMNANAIRVYTLHPPAFYEALLEYNQSADNPIYVFHGVWIDEEPLEETLDAFQPESTETFQKEMRNIVQAMHGDATIDPQPGHASGHYHADISPYVIGWIIGIEWYPFMVEHMSEAYADLGDFDGKYMYTDNANPMEYWLAEQFDYLMDYEVENYQSMRPLSFTNWVTTDNIDQPAEPLEQEDLATVDPNHIHTKEEASEIGMFASYHVYPYYPDFLNLEEKYTEHIDHRGERNNYAGYLEDLKSIHDIPILIAEFGIPASRGITHKNPFGWNQGFISEAQQGQIVSRLYEDILEQDMLGGLIFTWQDEWFKRTWNTMDYDNPDRRPFWSNAQTNEQHFGLMSFDRLKVKLNGQDDWDSGDELYSNSRDMVRTFTADHDERYLYLKFELEDAVEEIFKDHSLETHFSIRSNGGVEISDEIDFLSDFRLTLNGMDGKLEAAGDYDSFYYDYTERLDMFESTEEEMNQKEESFHPLRLALNKGLVRPDTGEELPFEYVETGELKYGIGDPDHEAYDSLSDYYYEDKIIEIRIPWMMLNARDPSQLEFIGDMWSEGIEASIEIEGIDLVTVFQNQSSNEVSFVSPVATYTWEKWDDPQYQERLKQSYDYIQKLFSDVE